MNGCLKGCTVVKKQSAYSRRSASWVRGFAGAVLVLLLSLLFSCAGSPGYKAYREGIFQGTSDLQAGDYKSALPQFLHAHQGDPTKAMPLALAGQSSYRLSDLAGASKYLAQADAIIGDSQDNASLIIKGYKALIAFKQGRQQDGMERLGEYLKYYRYSYPDQTYYDVERMYKSGNIVFLELEQLINDQIARYEKELFTFF